MIDQTQYNLKGLSGGEFQQLMSKLLPRIDKRYDGLVNSGAVEGTTKTRKGTPDIWIKRGKDCLICFEITVDERKTKLQEDLQKCIFLFDDILKKEYVCAVNYDPQRNWIQPLEQICMKSQIDFKLFHNNIIAAELDKKSNQDLRQLFLNIPKDNINQNILLANIESYVTQFNFSPELQDARELLKNNHIKSARERALAIQQKIENRNDIKEKEELYRIIANSYLLDPADQLSAITWIEKLVTVSQDEVSKKRRRALVLMLKKELSEAETVIDELIRQGECSDEVIELKCNLFFNQGNYAAGRAFLDAYDKDFKRKNYWYAAFYSAENSFREAILYAEKNLKTESSFRNRKLLFDSRVLYLDTQFGQLKIIEKEFIEAQEILKEADDLLNLISNNIPFKESDILTKKSIILNWLGEPDAALDTMNRAYNIFQKNPVLLRNRAVLLADKEQYDEALKDINRFLELSPDDIIAKRIKFRIMLKVNSKEAIETLNAELTKETTNKEYNLELEVLKVECLLGNLETTAAENLLADLKIKYSNSAILSIAEAGIYIARNKIDDAIRSLEKCIGKLDFRWNMQATLKLADLYLLKKEYNFYKKAKDVLEPYANVYAVSPFLSKYILCLYNLPQYDECLAYSSKIRELYGYKVEFIRYEASIQRYWDNFSAAIPLFEYLIQHSHKDKIRFQIELSNCYYRLGEKQKAYDIIEQSVKNDHSIEELLLFSRIYASYGKTEKAVKFAHKAYEMDTNDQYLTENFISTILFSGKEDLLISDEILKDYYDCLNNFEKRFPESFFLQKINMPEKTEELIDFFYKMLKESKARIIKEEELYIQKRLPVSIFSKRIGKDFINTWLHIRDNYTLPVWGETGNTNDLEHEKQIALKYSECYIDLQTILLLDYIGLLKKIHQIFSKIFVSQAIIDTLNMEIETLERFLDNPDSFITLTEDEQVRLINISAEYNKKKYDWLSGIRDVLKNKKLSFEIVGKPIKQSIDPQFEKIFNSLDTSETQSIINAMYNKKSALIGSSLLRNIMRGESFHCDCFGVLAVLNKFLSLKKMSIEKYLDVIIQLVLIDYKYIPFNAVFILYSLKINGYSENKITVMVLNLFKDPHWELQSAINVFVETLFLLWNADISDDLKEKWILKILNQLRYRIDCIMICDHIIQFLQTKEELVTLGRKKRNSIIRMLQKYKKESLCNA